MALDVERQDLQEATSVITLRGKLMLGEETAQLETLVPQLLKMGRKNLVFDLTASRTSIRPGSGGSSTLTAGWGRRVGRCGWRERRARCAIPFE